LVVVVYKAYLPKWEFWFDSGDIIADESATANHFTNEEPHEKFDTNHCVDESFL
jgi:hypothetical protein